MMPLRPGKPTVRRRGFTLVELIVAGVIGSFVIGAVTMSLAQLGRVKNTCKVRLDAYMRADSALTQVRRDLISALRSDDLFYMRVQINDFSTSTALGRFDRDEILIYNKSIDPARAQSYNGEGSEYETHYRVDEDESGPWLAQRRDPIVDEHEFAGGVATPLVDGVLGVRFRAFDGKDWIDFWDSDQLGMPHAIEIRIEASGYRMGDDPYADDAAIAVLRTIVPIDRLPALIDEEAIEELNALAEERLTEMRTEATEQAAEDEAAANSGNSATNPGQRGGRRRGTSSDGDEPRRRGRDRGRGDGGGSGRNFGGRNPGQVPDFVAPSTGRGSS